MRFVVLASLALIEGCGATQPAGGAKTVSTPPRDATCPLARATKESPECFAVRCAEASSVGTAIPATRRPILLSQSPFIL